MVLKKTHSHIDRGAKIIVLAYFEGMYTRGMLYNNMMEKWANEDKLIR